MNHSLKHTHRPIPEHMFVTCCTTTKRSIENDTTDKHWTSWAKVLSSRLRDMDPAEADIRTEQFSKQELLPFVTDGLLAAGTTTVRFAEKKYISFVPSSRDLTMQEKAATWHTVSVILDCADISLIARSSD